MADGDESDFAEISAPHPWRRLAVVLACVVAAVLLGLMIYRALSNINGVAMKSIPPTTVDMLPPPPPPAPPPPPQEKPPEPQEKQDTPQQPTPLDKPAPAPMQINGPAQAGSDSYGMAAGSGGGMGAPAASGTCTGPNCGAPKPLGIDRFWGRNVANQLEDYLQGTRKVNVDAFVGQFDVWVNAAGAITQVRLTSSTGDGRLDQTLVGLLNQARGLKPPPPSIAMPQRIKVGRKR